MIGQVIGNYRIVGELGKGGMGVVYRAEHTQIGRAVALKMLLPQMSSDATIVQRFFNEARAAAAIDHPGIVEVHDFGLHTDGRAYLVMPLLHGESLDHRLMRPVAPLEAASLVAQVAAALGAAHARGIVHRDLKPDNIYLVPNELLPGGVQVKLLDFGIAKLADDRGGSAFKTQTGQLIGTPAYMSPEQCMGRSDLDHRTDLYSLGCILYHLLCGRPPFYSEQGTGVMIAMHLRDPVPDPRRLAPHVPDALVAITLRLLEKEPDARFQSAQELRQALVAAGAVAPPTAPPAGFGGPTQPWSGPEAYGATVAATPASKHVPGGGGMTTSSGSAAELLPEATTPMRPSRRPDAARGEAPKQRTPWLALGAVVVVVGAGVGVGVAMRGGGGARVTAGSGGDGSAGSGSDGSGSALLIASGSDGSGSGAAAAGSDGGGGDGTGSAGSDDGTAGSGSGSGSDSRDPGDPGDPGSDAGSAAIAPPVPPRPRGPCAPGQILIDDEGCCWPGQTWMPTISRCTGTPTSCPTGMRPVGERCVATVVVVPPDPSLTASAPAIRLAQTTYAPNEALDIELTGPIASTPSRRAWIAVSPAGSPPSTYGEWRYLDDGARRAQLRAPRAPGAYEVRIHTDYPAKAYNVARTARFTVALPAEAPDSSPTPAAAQRFTLAAAKVRPGAKIDLRFPEPLRAAAGERFWVTTVAATAADSAWGRYEYVAPGARGMSLDAPTTRGAYEVRLHANYPKRSTNVVFRAALTVE